jgi:hypothetical protein
MSEDTVRSPAKFELEHDEVKLIQSLVIARSEATKQSRTTPSLPSPASRGGKGGGIASLRSQ